MTGHERREQLLDVGRALFADKGFEAVSVEEIAAKASVSKPVVYEHFGGKEGLYMHVTGSASRLSFGGTALFTLAVQFCPQPAAQRPAAAGTARDASAGGGDVVTISGRNFGADAATLRACLLYTSDAADE